MIFNAGGESPKKVQGLESSSEVEDSLGVPKIPQIETFVDSGSRRFFRSFSNTIKKWNGLSRITFEGNETYRGDRFFSYEDRQRDYNFEDLFAAFTPEENRFRFKQIRNPELAKALKNELQVRRELGLIKRERAQATASNRSFDTFIGEVLRWNSASVDLSIGFAEGYGSSGFFGYDSGDNIDRLRAGLVGGSAQNRRTGEFQIIIDTYFANRALAFFEEKNKVNVAISKLKASSKNRLTDPDIFSKLQDVLRFPRASFTIDVDEYLGVQTPEDLQLRNELVELVEDVRKVSLKSSVYRVLTRINNNDVQAILDARQTLSDELSEAAQSGVQILDTAFIIDLLEDIRYKAEIIFADQVERIITGRDAFFSDAFDENPRSAFNKLVKRFEDAGLISTRFRDTIARYREQIDALFYAFYTNAYLLFINQNRNFSESEIGLFIY